MILKNPLVSFCISTYKRPAILAAQIKSLLLQTYDHFEIVISDNDPTGSGRQALENIDDPRVHYAVNETNVGMMKSFNKSLERSRGDFIVMITDDDPAYPDMLQTLVGVQAKYPDYGVYAGCGDVIIESEEASKYLKQNIGVHNKTLANIPQNEIMTFQGDSFLVKYLDDFFSETYLLWSSCMIARKAILSIEGVPTYGSELFADNAFLLAAASQNGLVYVNKSLGAQLMHGNNFSYNFDNLREKFVKSPVLFHQYLKSHLKHFSNWKEIETKIWKFAGRHYVEYSLVIQQKLKLEHKSTRDFNTAVRKAFAPPQLKKWKYKFYLKAYARPVFNLLLKFKNLFK